MWSLFSTSPEQSGFRLQYMELYNWGTFDKKVFRVSPKSNNSLLTGANGSGKTTFVDALLTLLVPLKKDRFYNQSSGVEKKGDRTEESYVLGYYGDIQKEGSSETIAQKLRTDNAFSVLLACFENEEGNTVTLFQCRWFSNKNLKRIFGIAHKPLEIERDIHPFDANGQWKKRLEQQYNTPTKRNIELFNDSPSKYAERMIQLFGMRSSKALSLFNQTVGIKVLGDLNEFIRTNMLEAQDTEREWLLLKDSFNTLLSTKVNIEKSKEQIQLLEPIKEQGEKYGLMQEDAINIRADHETANTFFITQGLELFKKSISGIKTENQKLIDKIVRLTQSIEGLKEESTDLTVQIKNDDVGRQLKDFERKLNTLKSTISNRKDTYNKYLKLCNVLGYDPTLKADLFNANIKEASTDLSSFEVKLESLNKDIYDKEGLLQTYNSEKETINSEFDFYSKRATKIPSSVNTIREQIARDLNLNNNILPFIGELIQVKDDEKKWEFAIERVLHSFALCMIVPESHYDKINNYINKTDLKGRIVYFKHEEVESLKELQSKDPENLISKLNFNTKSPYFNWVQKKLFDQYAYRCIEDVSGIKGKGKFVTMNGLIRSGNFRHEKDDRRSTKNKSNSVLGWDNKEKLSYVKDQLKTINEKLASCDSDLMKLRTAKQTINERLVSCRELMAYDNSFEALNYPVLQDDCDLVQEQIEALQNTDNRVRILQAQLNKLSLKIRAEEAEVEGLKKQQWGLDKQVDTNNLFIEKLIKEKEDLLDSIDLADLDLDSFKERNPQVAQLTVSNFEQMRSQFTQDGLEKLAQIEREGSKLRESLQKKMLNFKNPPERIVQKYKDWRSEVFNLPEEVEYVSAYFNLLEELRQDNLPEYEQKFENYLTDTLLGRVGEFKHFFDNWKSKIEENIQALNTALRNIDYKDTPKTYIQLVAQRSIYPNQRTFRTYLEKAMPNAVDFESNLEEKKKHFENNIRPLIDQLEADDKWRKEVMDVRTWFKFFAEEFYKENGEKMKSYENMGKLSGGEKAQLTYTILGSAISYQFGLTSDGMQTKSFRFIAIDESFSNQDDEKARYLMNLCKQLNLQLLVVTPSDKINVVQDYISYVHLVERRNNKNSWLYDMPIMQFLDTQEAY
jgi:uncharacterized protein YPO0396